MTADNPEPRSVPDYSGPATPPLRPPPRPLTIVVFTWALLQLTGSVISIVAAVWRLELPSFFMVLIIPTCYAVPFQVALASYATYVEEEHTPRTRSCWMAWFSLLVAILAPFVLMILFALLVR